MIQETFRIIVDSVATCFGIKTANMELEECIEEYNDLYGDFIGVVYKNAFLNYWNEKYEEIIAGLGLLLFFAVVTIIFII